MYADPQSITINAVAQSFVRVGSEKPAILGQFKTADGLMQFQVRQNKTAKRKRREVVLTQTKIAPDPITNVNAEISTSVGIYVDEPNAGFSDTELAYLTSGLIAWFTAPNRDALLAGQL